MKLYKSKFRTTLEMEQQIRNYMRTNGEMRRTDLVEFILDNYDLSQSGAQFRIKTMYAEGQLERISTGWYRLSEDWRDEPIDAEYKDITEQRLTTIPTRPQNLTKIETDWIKSHYLTRISWWLRLATGDNGSSNQHKELFDKWMPESLEAIRKFYRKVRFHYSHLCILMDKPVPDDFKEEEMNNA